MTTYRQHAAARDNLRSQRPIALSAETEVRLEILKQNRIELKGTKMENTKVSALEKQITEVKRMLEYPFKRFGWVDFNGREGYALSKKGVTESYTESWNDKNRYRLSCGNNGRLTLKAYQWCVDNDLKTEADAYDRNALHQYVNLHKKRWLARKDELERELVTVNDALAKYDAMLEELS